MFPGEADFDAERAAFLAMIESLTDDEFEAGKTLCEAWSPRDVLAHVIGIDEGGVEYVKALGHVGTGNQRIVEDARSQTRAEITDRARRWVERPSILARVGAYGLLGDLAIHHQDVLRGLGKTREVPAYASRAIVREGCVLGGRKLLTHRIVPNDIGRPIGRGREVQGTAEALGLWLAGRESVSPELEFG